MKFFYKKIIIILLFYIIFTNYFKGYNFYYPSIPVYTNNKKELEVVKSKMRNRSSKDISFFYKTNKSVTYAFLPLVNENIAELEKMSMSQNNIILFFKYLINRRRPWQENINLKPINIETAQTPSYPAGHAYQAYYLAKKLSKKYPEKKDILIRTAIRCDNCRVKAGLHYPSDGVFARQLVDLLN